MRRPKEGLLRGEAGQALVVVAVAVVALLAALALAVDWGYALTQRRIMQNAADAAALGAGRLLASSVVWVNGGPAFAVPQESVWCAATHYALANRSFAAAGRMFDMELTFGNGATHATWSPSAVPAGGTCPAHDGVPVPSDTLFVRVRTSTTYHSLFAALVGQGELTAAASARVRLSGAAVPITGPVWPLLRHYNPADYSIACAPGSCDPTTVDPLTFWAANDSDSVFGNFKGLVDFSRDSSRSPAHVPQLLSDWDQSGSLSAIPPTVPKVDQSGNCGGTWDTAGGEAPSNQDKQCSIPNWFYYTFGGQLTLDHDWSVGLPIDQESPSALGSRVVCDSPPDPAPSCGNPALGDWVETAFGDVGQNMSENMKTQIRDHGFVGPFSDRRVASGPNRGAPFGKALRVLVYLWDCAETFDGSGPAGDRWDLIVPSGADCSSVRGTGRSPTPDRLHLFTVAPFTFYEGLVTTSSIEGYWGGAFGDPRSCPGCRLNPLANTADLVADDEGE